MKTFIIAALLALLAVPVLAQTPYVPPTRAKAPPEPAYPAVWPRLTAAERKNIVAELRPGGQIVIACNSANCRALAKDIAGAFKAGGWTATQISRGGIGIDGVIGMRVDSCGIGADRIKEFVERVTSRKIEVVEDGNCADPHAYLVIGTRE